MGGRITSVDRGVNRFGIPWEALIAEQAKANARLTAAMKRALEAWLLLDAANREGRPRKVRRALRRAAVELTEKALL